MEEIALFQAVETARLLLVLASLTPGRIDADTSLVLVRGYGKALSQLPPSYSSANQNNTLSQGPAHAHPKPGLAPWRAAVKVHAGAQRRS